jgi:replicative DNA helicase
MLELHNKQQPVDLLTVTDALKKLNKLDDIGGIAYLTSLANVVPTAANVVTMRTSWKKNLLCGS